MSCQKLSDSTFEYTWFQSRSVLIQVSVQEAVRVELEYTGFQFGSVLTLACPIHYIATVRLLRRGYGRDQSPQAFFASGLFIQQTCACDLATGGHRQELMIRSLTIL